MLRDEGLLYMNPLSYFWELEDDELRSDPFEGIGKVDRGRSGSIKLADGTDLPIEITDWTLRIPLPESEEINIFCMYALRPSVGSYPVDERNLRFGGHALILFDPQRFIDQIHHSLNDQKIKHEARLVEYVPRDYAGDLGWFRKLENFAYQSEWRLICYGGNGHPRLIRIGSIKDISVVMPNGEVNERITIVQ
jgi:hypothetical protein